MTILHVIKRLDDGSVFRLGTLSQLSNGVWRFLPNVSGRRPSTGRHLRAYDAIPRWIKRMAGPVEIVEPRTKLATTLPTSPIGASAYE